MRTDMSSEIKVVASIDPAAIYNSNGTKTGADVDTQGYEALTFVLQSGVLTDGTWTSKIYGWKDGETNANEVEVTGNGLIPSDPSFAITDDSKTFRVGVNIQATPYRYFRQKATQAAATTGGFLCGCAILGKPRFAPVATP